jgi:hypothetical protein
MNLKVVGDDHNNGDVAYLLTAALRDSRFTARVEVEDGRVKISLVRLKAKKPYCGAHPGPCLPNFFGQFRKHINAHFLEGADWVGFNDGVNDLLDRHSVAADFWSASMEFRGRMWIRRGTRRRTCYDCTYGPNNHPSWRTGRDDGGRWGDYCGRLAPRSEYPAGTPGHPCWLESEVALLETAS